MRKILPPMMSSCISTWDNSAFIFSNLWTSPPRYWLFDAKLVLTEAKCLQGDITAHPLITPHPHPLITLIPSSSSPSYLHPLITLIPSSSSPSYLHPLITLHPHPLITLIPSSSSPSYLHHPHTFIILPLIPSSPSYLHRPHPHTFIVLTSYLHHPHPHTFIVLTLIPSSSSPSYLHHPHPHTFIVLTLIPSSSSPSYLHHPHPVLLTCCYPPFSYTALPSVLSWCCSQPALTESAPSDTKLVLSIKHTNAHMCTRNWQMIALTRSPHSTSSSPHSTSRSPHSTYKVTS